MGTDGVMLKDVAAAVGGTVEGDGAIRVSGLAALADARPGDLSFLANPKYAALAAETQASAVMVAKDWTGPCPGALIRVANPDRAFIHAAVFMTPPPPVPPPGVHPTAVVADGVRLGEQVSIGPFCVLEAGVVVGARTAIGAHGYVGHDTTIGADCRFYPLVSIRERTRIGDRVIIHNGAVVGSDGFGYAPDGGRWIKIPQLGTVEIGDDVELGANVTVDRARFGKTVIGRGVKIDNLVQIAHNVQVGEHSAMASQVGISGSAIIGAHVQLGGQAGIAGHLKIGDGAIVGAQAGISKTVPPGAFVFGTPAMPMDKFSDIRAHTNRLPELKKRVMEMERRLAQLEAGRPGGDSGAT
ncbi:MAG: UDP-3-O-(3-hydroxymyristoyl)glucosamine N-acyltransferase [Lentisphaerae bacterium]|nr:UDP-3-O-(3-hydroxymyristoyl)glucosamine N-acyltransferase [Lentisphaerota bacterium]